LHLSLEAEGLLIRISAFIMEAGVALPSDMTTASRMIGVHRNKLNKVLAELIEAGEINNDDDGIYSPRAMAEFKRSQNALAREQVEPETIPPSNPEATPGQPQGNSVPTPQVEAEKSEQILRAQREEKKREEGEDSPIIAPSAAKPVLRASRLANDWVLPDDWNSWARVTFPQTTADQIQIQADTFRDYWTAKGGKDAAKLDWEATWRNWCRKNFSTGPIRPRAQPPPTAKTASQILAEKYAGVH
jgi:hypothetical protein